ncbi:MAG: 5-methyltetrahydropteroyltriglutamate--homocysteine S-methyltransferase, partial [Veillonella sp.]|nr:5-methyltetrahydropteroyltriglutamate--homocysteine S-methyltransferase [Veillonella sp.]
MIKVSNLGYPRLGEGREWKELIESYWDKKISQEDLLASAKELRIAFLKKQEALGVDLIPVGDFSLYDHILDLSFQFNIIPERFQGQDYNLDLYFAIARGNKDHVASSMKKWFNTNYHYLLPEWAGVKPEIKNHRLLDLYVEARALVGDKAKPVITGPLTYVALSTQVEDKGQAIKTLLPLYQEVFQELVQAGATYIQVDEPILVTDQGRDYIDLAQEVYAYFSQSVPQAKIILQTYFEGLVDPQSIGKLPVAAIGLDFVHGLEENLAALEKGYFQGKEIFAGLVNGRNVWGTDLEKALDLAKHLGKYTDKLVVQPSCSLLHVPVTRKNETALEPVLLNGLAFADEKLEELRILADQANAETNDDQDTSVEEVTKSPAFQERVLAYQALQAADFRNEVLENVDDVRQERPLSFPERYALQHEKLGLPILPTTTIGSFPQSAEIRRQRLAWRRKEISDQAYKDFIKAEIARWITIQEDLDIDVLVHGEFERVDMVEFFGQKLAGFTTTQLGWVQSYGSRAVKPPIIYGDVKHIQPLT